MSNTQQLLQPQDLGPDAAVVLSKLADDLEEKWTFGGGEGTEFAKVDDAVRQQISVLGKHHKVFEGKRLGLVRFKTNMIYPATTPTYFVPLRTDPGVSSISGIPPETGSVQPSVSTVSLEVGKVIYVTGSVRVVSPLDVLLLEVKD